MASPLKGTQRENHKYLRREEKNGKYVYIYEEPNTGNLVDTGRLKAALPREAQKHQPLVLGLLLTTE